VVQAGAWLSDELLAHPDMRASLNQHLAGMARTLAPAFSSFLTRHISDTVKAWDNKDMSRQIELNIGKDLQFIRVNGTLVGGMVGLLLYAVSAFAQAAKFPSPSMPTPAIRPTPTKKTASRPACITTSRAAQLQPCKATKSTCAPCRGSAAWPCSNPAPALRSIRRT
jgi:hypothetical protein